MKRLFACLITLALSVAFAAPFLLISVFAADPPAAPAVQTGPLSCPDVLSQGKNTGDKSKRPVIDTSKDIVVLLTEPISSAGNGISCGRIIDCLRSTISTKNQQDKQNAANDVQKGQVNNAIKTADAALNQALYNDYWQCIVAGKDGLDLLNNYAGLVYRWIAGIVGSVCILMVIISGIEISMGGLSQEEVSAAKDRVTRSLMGLVVLFLSAFILYTINPIFFS